MPVVIIKSAVGLLGALIIFTSGLINLNTSLDYTITHHKETRNAVIFYCADEGTKTVVNKNDGKVKITFKDRRKEIEFDVEFSGEIAPEDRTQINEIFGQINEYVKRDLTIKEKIKRNIKNKLTKIISKM